MIIKLVEKGANLIGTEYPKLLIEEYKTIRDTLLPVPARQTGSKTKKTDKYRRKTEEHLSRRDKYISKRIDETLKDNETGILFIGMMHKVNTFFPNSQRYKDRFLKNSSVNLKTLSNRSG